MPRKNVKNKKMYEKIAAYCEVGQEVVSAVPVFTFCGNREIEIDGCGGILEYFPEKITLSVKGEKFTVFGECLTLSDFRDKVLYVRGSIKAVVFGDIAKEEDDEC